VVGRGLAWAHIACSSLLRRHHTYLRYPPNILIPVLLGEAQILVEAEAHIIAVKTVRSVSKVQKVLLERCRDGGFARRREAGEPDGEAFLLAVAIALGAREGRVPCDVAGVVCVSR